MARYAFAPGKGLTVDERRQIEASLVAADRMLGETIDGDRTDVVEAAAEMLFSNFKASRKFQDEAERKADDQRVFDGFLIALSGRPAAAVQEAVRRLIRREAKDLSKTFVPTAAEMADLVERIAAEWTYQRNRLERLLRLEEEGVAPQSATAARQRSVPGSGREMERPVESASTPANYGRKAQPSRNRAG